MQDLFRILVRFFMGGLLTLTNSTPRYETKKTLEASEPLEELMDFISGLGDSESKYPNTMIKPFELHMQEIVTSDALRDPTLFVECFLVALNSICEEIKLYVPDSTFHTGIKNVDGIYEGHISWTIDKQTQYVYPICMDLFYDGFFFRASSQTFVITTRINNV